MKKFNKLFLVLLILFTACTSQSSPSEVPTVETTVPPIVETLVTPESVVLAETIVPPAIFPLSQEAVAQLREVAVKTSEGYPKESYFLLVAGDGSHIVGYSHTLLIPADIVYTEDSTSLAGCTIKSLEYGEWDVTDVPPIFLDLGDPITMGVVNSLGLNHVPSGSFVLPDLCERNFLEEYTGELSWIETSHKSDMYEYSFSGFVVEVHTNSEQCDLYSWPDNEFFIVVVKFEGQPDREFLLEQGDLLKLEGGDIQGVRSVYITVVDGVPVYLWNRWTYSPQDASIIVSGYCLEGDCMPVASEISSPLPYLTDKWGLEEQSAPIPLIP